MSTEMLAWAAGFFEGEGCIVDAVSANGRLHLVLVNTDLERLELFRSVLGCGEIRERRHVAHPNLRTQYQWQVYADSALVAYRMIEPWLGARRRDKFELVLAKREAYVAQATAARPCEGCGTSFRPRFVAMSKHQRYCTPTCNQRTRDRRRAEQKLAA